MRVRHELLPRDFQRRLNFARWLTERCRRNEDLRRNLVVGDEATFCMNGQVNSRNVRAYAPAGNLPAFNYDVIIIIIIELYLPTVLFRYKIKTIYKDESDLPIGRALKYLQVNIIGKLQKI